MARQKKQEEQAPGAPAYMNTYGDMVTLMLTFFVLLFAMSSIDEAKLEALAESFQSIVFLSPVNSGANPQIIELMGSGIMQMPSLEAKGDDPDEELEESAANVERAELAQQELAQMASDFETYFADNYMEGMYQLEIMDYYIELTLPDQMLFDSARANLKPEALEVLDVVIDKLAEYPESDIEIIGHTDSDPINTPQFPSNWELSSSRATAVGRYMINEREFNPLRLLAIGRGEYFPVAPNDTDENKARNRRVEIRIKSAYYSGSDSAMYE